MIDFIFEFIDELVECAKGMFYLVIVIVIGALSIGLCVCLFLGWLIDWRLSLLSFPALCLVITVFNRITRDD